MSNTLAIADVTATLVTLLQNAITHIDSGLTGINVTSLPLDKALDKYSSGQTHDQVNVFLYHVVASEFWRNQSMPLQVRRGETAPPPLGLNLHYLISAWGATDDVKAHRALGAAMSYLHDNPVFNRSDLQQWLPGSDLYLQVERVRITEEPLTVDEMYKLWSAFQTNYRVSAAYQVSVLLIESTTPATAPLPALSVQIPGPKALNVVTGVQPTLDLGTLDTLAPAITSLTPQHPRPFSLYGETLTINGYQLVDATASSVQAQLTLPALSAPVLLPTTVVPATPPALPSLSVTLNNSALLAGNYTLALVYTYPNDPQGIPTKPTVVTNELPFTLSPTITTFPTSPAPLVPPGTGSASLTVTVSPALLSTQRIFLLVGDQVLSPSPPLTTTPPTTVATLSFSATVPPGNYYVRIRVDGTDSPIIVLGSGAPAFNPAAQIVIGP
jgi:Pvc16 N-terminal domain